MAASENRCLYRVDPAVLVADATLAGSVLQWKPKYTSLSSIVSHAWFWEKKIGGS